MLICYLLPARGWHRSVGLAPPHSPETLRL